MVNSPYYLHSSTLYPKTVQHLYHAKAASEIRIAQNKETAPPSIPGPWSIPAKGMVIPDPSTSSYMHMREAGPLVSRRPITPAPVRYETMIGSKILHGKKDLHDNVWQKKKVKTHGKAVPMRGDCVVGELFRAQREITSKLTSRYRNMIDAFKAADNDRSGTLTRQEVKVLFKKLQIQCRDVALDTLLDVIDTDESRAVDYTEFAALLTSNANELNAMIAGD